MGNVLDYVRREFRGFAELPFGDVDSLVLSELSYMRLTDLVPTFGEAKSVATVSIRELLRAESYDDGNNDCIKAILPVLDNFERAISVAENNEDAQSMLSGVKMIQKQLMDALSKRGLEEVRPVGEKFDPNEHNAVLRVSADEAEGEPGTICEVLQTGYRVKGKMLRHPMVKVIED